MPQVYVAFLASLLEEAPTLKSEGCLVSGEEDLDRAMASDSESQEPWGFQMSLPIAAS